MQLQTESCQDGSASDNPINDSLFSPDKVEIYKKHYEEGYDQAIQHGSKLITQLKFVATP